MAFFLSYLNFSERKKENSEVMGGTGEGAKAQYPISIPFCMYVYESKKMGTLDIYNTYHILSRRDRIRTSKYGTYIISIRSPFFFSKLHIPFCSSLS
jgi:hypothetical protein